MLSLYPGWTGPEKSKKDGLPNELGWQKMASFK